MHVLHLLLILTLFIPTAPLMGSCPGNSWYISTITISPPHLPPGVTISSTPSVYEIVQVTIANTTDIPLYLFTRNTSGMVETSDPLVHIPSPGYVVREKLVDGRVFLWKREGDTESWHDWAEYTSDNQPIPSLTIHLQGFDPYDVFAPSYRYINPSPQERRPDDAVAPEPQSTYILLSYGWQLMKIPVTVNYSLTPHYPDQYEATKSCMGSVGLGLALYLVGLPCLAVIGLITIAIVIVRWLRR